MPIFQLCLFRPLPREQRGSPVEPHPPALVFVHREGKAELRRDRRVGALAGDRRSRGWNWNRGTHWHTGEFSPGTVNSPAHKGAAPESGTQEPRERCSIGQDEGPESANQDAYGNEVGEDKIGDRGECTGTEKSRERKLRGGKKGWECWKGGKEDKKGGKVSHCYLDRSFAHRLRDVFRWFPSSNAHHSGSNHDGEKVPFEIVSL